MNAGLIQTVIVIILVVWAIRVAYKVFHSRDIGRNERFGLAMSILAVTLALLVLTYAQSSVYQIWSFVIIVGICAVDAPFVYRGVKARVRAHRILHRVLTVCIVYCALFYRNRGVISLKQETIDQMHAFINKVSDKHRQQGRYYFKIDTTNPTKSDEKMAERDYTDQNLTKIMNAYWKKYKD